MLNDGTMAETERILRTGASKLGLKLSDEQVEKFTTYLSLIVGWNKRVNLVGTESEKEIVVRHFLDSLSCFKSGKIKENLKAIDVGTGGGFPGIPIKIAQPGLNLTLLDSQKKRVDFLEGVISELNFKKVRIVWRRAEDFGRDLEERETYDLAFARAVAPLPVLLEYSLPLLSVGGRFVSQRAQKAEEEVVEVGEALRVLGGEIEEILPVKVPYLQAKRHLVLVKKVGKASERYPRRAGIPAKRPLK
jgi:16S rRNA (guanine527-N7)-methyltransferase